MRIHLQVFGDTSGQSVNRFLNEVGLHRHMDKGGPGLLQMSAECRAHAQDQHATAKLPGCTRSRPPVPSL